MVELTERKVGDVARGPQGISAVVVGGNYAQLKYKNLMASKQLLLRLYLQKKNRINIFRSCSPSFTRSVTILNLGVRQGVGSFKTFFGSNFPQEKKTGTRKFRCLFIDKKKMLRLFRLKYPLSLRPQFSPSSFHSAWLELGRSRGPGGYPRLLSVYSNSWQLFIY